MLLLKIKCFICLFFSIPPDNLSIQEFQRNESIDVEVRKLFKTFSYNHLCKPNSRNVEIMKLLKEQVGVVS